MNAIYAEQSSSIELVHGSRSITMYASNTDETHFAMDWFTSALTLHLH